MTDPLIDVFDATSARRRGLVVLAHRERARALRSAFAWLRDRFTLRVSPRLHLRDLARLG